MTDDYVMELHQKHCAHLSVDDSLGNDPIPHTEAVPEEVEYHLLAIE